MRKRFVAIYSVLVVAIVLLAVLVPSCTTTPTTGTIEVKATLDGSPWTGAVQYTLTGPGAASPITGTSVEDSFTVDAGNWASAYVSGGPAGASFVDVTPSPTQSVSAGGTITFTFNFKTTPTQGTIEVKATLDGSPWTGAVQYTLTPGPGSPISGTASVPKSFTVDPGTWTCAYVSGGPAGAGFVNITPSPTQSVSNGGKITFTLNFKTTTRITIRIEPPEKDAEVREASPDTNFGGAPEMWVGPLVPPEGVLRHRAFVWFSLASLPADATIQSAKLNLYHSACAGSGNATHGAYRVTAVWEEGNITWNNQPSSAAGPTYEITFPVCNCSEWRSWNVTPDIDALAIGTGWVSWVIKIIPETAAGRKRVVYLTKESDTDPYLEITYTP
jgi:hypothetical protein